MFSLPDYLDYTNLSLDKIIYLLKQKSNALNTNTTVMKTVSAGKVDVGFECCTCVCEQENRHY